MSAVDRRRASYRAQIVGAAEREFARVGFADAKVAEIARAADLSLATVYKTLPSKVDIWNALHEERMVALLARVDTAVAEATSPLDRLLRGIAAVAEFLVDHDDYLSLSLGAGSGWLSADGSTDLQRNVWSAGLDTIAAGVSAAQAAGEIRGLRPRIATGLVVSALQVWLADWVASGRTGAAAELSSDLTDHLRTVLSTPRRT